MQSERRWHIIAMTNHTLFKKQKSVNLPLNRNGIFAIKLDSYLKYYYDSSVVKNDVYINEC